MFIKRLRILTKISNNEFEELREINFKEGINFIVDSEQSGKHNKVGKTTCLKLIDLSLGAQNKDAIYKDQETESVNEELKSFINKNKICTDLLLTNDMNNPTEEISIRTELFDRGSRYINGSKTSYNKVVKYLNEILFNNQSQIPTFRNVIKSFIRIFMTKDNSQFLKTVDNFSSYLEYRAIYNFLFEISDPQNDIKLFKLKRELDKINNNLKKNASDDIVKIKQINAVIEQEINRLETEIDDLVDKKSFEANRYRINSVRKKYEEITQQINILDFDISQLRKYINETEEKSEVKINRELIENFFEEVSEILPDITKTFLELVEFNNQLNKNKLAYFNDRIEELIIEKKEREYELNYLISKNLGFITLVEQNKVDMYYSKLRELDELKANKVKNETKISSITDIEKEKDNIIKEIINLKEICEVKEQVFQGKMDIFNQYFKLVSSRVNKEHPVLLYDPNLDKFPLSIGQLSEGTSTGTRKSLIASYDIAYQLFARAIKKKIPKFIIHDVLESIEGDDLRALVHEVESNKIQFIAAVLKEKLVSSNFSSEEQNKMIVLELSLEDKLFERRNLGEKYISY